MLPSPSLRLEPPFLTSSSPFKIGDIPPDQISMIMPVFVAYTSSSEHRTPQQDTVAILGIQYRENPRILDREKFTRPGRYILAFR
jgi:hypothetical protein